MSRLLPLLLFPLVAVPFVSVPAVQPPDPVREQATAPPPRGTWPMYGGTLSRNMVNHHDRNMLTGAGVTGGFFRWKADLGSLHYGQPVVSGGRVLVGTNNDRPRNRRDTKEVKDPDTGKFEDEPIDKGTLMCFDAATGKFLWQAVHDKLPSGQVNDWPHIGVCSTPTVEGDRVYYVSNQCRVVCVDLIGFADGNQGFQGEKYQDATDADILWEFDMIKELGVFPHNGSAGCPLIVGDLLFTVTSNGVNEDHVTIPAPEAPSFIALNKYTGRLVWRSSAPGKNIMHGQWAQPCYTADPVPQVIFPGGDGWLWAFDPPTGRLLWKFDCNPKWSVYELGGSGTRSDFIAAAVVDQGRLFIGTGQDPEHTTGIAWFWCVDLRQAVERAKRAPNRDVSPEVLDKRPGDRALVAVPNPDSALRWVFGGEERRPWAVRDFAFGRTMSTACVVDDVVYIGEITGILHCLDAKTGKQFWEYDAKASMWGAAYYVDGKVLLGNDQGELWVFRHDPKPETIDELDFTAETRKEAMAKRREKRREVERKYLIQKYEFDAPIRSTPCVAGGVLYVATEKTLYAIGGQ